MTNGARDAKSGKFVEGQSGNPKGRPAGRRKSWAKIAEILSEPVPVRRPDGTFENLDNLEVAFLATCRKALKGDRAALFNALNTMQEITPPDEPDPAQTVHREPDLSEIPIVGDIMANRDTMPRDMSPATALGLILFGAQIEAELDAEEQAAIENS